MNIACIGWGSLIWDPRDLLVDHNWRQDGPKLPIEFLRTSKDGRLTLVINDKFSAVGTWWSQMTTTDIGEAIESLRIREDCKSTKPIGVMFKSDPVPENSVKRNVYSWLQNMYLDAVIWTNLGPKFNGTNGRIPSVEEAIKYLERLPETKKAKAEEYVRKAPTTVTTIYRSAFESTLGWFPISV